MHCHECKQGFVRWKVLIVENTQLSYHVGVKYLIIQVMIVPFKVVMQSLILALDVCAIQHHDN